WWPRGSEAACCWVPPRCSPASAGGSWPLRSWSGWPRRQSRGGWGTTCRSGGPIRSTTPGSGPSNGPMQSWCRCSRCRESCWPSSDSSPGRGPHPPQRAARAAPVARASQAGHRPSEDRHVRAIRWEAPAPSAASAAPIRTSGQPGSRPEVHPSAHDQSPSTPMKAIEAPRPTNQSTCRECAWVSETDGSRRREAAGRVSAWTVSCRTLAREYAPASQEAISSRGTTPSCQPCSGSDRSTPSSTPGAGSSATTASSAAHRAEGPSSGSRAPERSALSSRLIPSRSSGAAPRAARRYTPVVTSAIEVGRNKRGRRSYGFDDVAVVPSRRTRDPEDVSTTWQVDAYHFDIPIFAAPMDSLMSPETAIELGRLGGLGVLDLEGLWTRYEDP